MNNTTSDPVKINLEQEWQRVFMQQVVQPRGH